MPSLLAGLGLGGTLTLLGYGELNEFKKTGAVTRKVGTCACVCMYVLDVGVRPSIMPIPLRSRVCIHVYVHICMYAPHDFSAHTCI